jgi:Family of unknown function (DUF6165)
MQVEISTGELVDKMTILEIKLERISDPEKLRNIRREYDMLGQALEKAGIARDSEQFLELKSVNLELWQIEDRIRAKEKAKEFDAEFIELARSVYFANDRRSDIKRSINLATGSSILEEKHHVDYGRPRSKP